MSTRPPRPPARRLALRLLRLALRPLVWLFPGTGWVRMYNRLCALEGVRPMAPRRARGYSPALGGFWLLVGVAAVVYLADAVRRPRPEPTRAAVTAPRAR